MKLSIVVISYFGGKLVKVSPRENIYFTIALGEGTMLDEFYRSAFEFGLNFNRQQKLKIYRAELYTADPNGPDEYFVEASGLQRIDLSSTGEQIIQNSYAKAPLVVLKLFIVVA